MSVGGVGSCRHHHRLSTQTPRRWPALGLWPRLALWVPTAALEEDSEALEEHKIVSFIQMAAGLGSFGVPLPAGKGVSAALEEWRVRVHTHPVARIDGADASWVVVCRECDDDEVGAAGGSGGNGTAVPVEFDVRRA